jgi:hypothetical protein
MAEYNARFCPICRGAMDFIPRHYICRCAEHGLFKVTSSSRMSR